MGDATPCVWPAWAPLVDVATDYATLTGWRFKLSDFMAGLEDPRQSNEVRVKAKVKAMPIALEFAVRIRSCIDATASAAIGQPTPLLVAEFQACQRLVQTEAVYNSVVATLASVGLGDGERLGKAVSLPLKRFFDERGQTAPVFGRHLGPSLDGLRDDMAQPIEVVAARLAVHVAVLERSPALAHEKRRRLRHASFVVEFGLQHGLPELRDTTSEAALRDFLRRLGEWEGAGGHKHAAGAQSRKPGARELEAGAGELEAGPACEVATGSAPPDFWKPPPPPGSPPPTGSTSAVPPTFAPLPNVAYWKQQASAVLGRAPFGAHLTRMWGGEALSAWLPLHEQPKAATFLLTLPFLPHTVAGIAPYLVAGTVTCLALHALSPNRTAVPLSAREWGVVLVNLLLSLASVLGVARLARGGIQLARPLMRDGYVDSAF